MKRHWLKVLLALALALLMTMPAMAEELLAAEVASEAVEAYVPDEGDMPLLAPDYDPEESGDFFDIELSTKKASASVMAGMTFPILLAGATGSDWKSSKPSVATVSMGIVNALSPGVTKISVKATLGGKTQTRTLKLEVLDPAAPQEVWITNYYDDELDEWYYFDDGDTIHCVPGEHVPLDAHVYPDTAISELTWKSSSKKVANFDSSGDLVCYKPGKTKITVSTQNGKKTTLKVVVDKNKFVHNYVNTKAFLAEAIDNEDVDIFVKGIDVQAYDKVVVTVLVANGTDHKVSKLNNLLLCVMAGYHDLDEYGEIDWSDPDWYDMVKHTFSSVKVGLKSHAAKEIKVTFTGSMVVDPWWHMNSDLFDYDFYYNFDY